MKKTVLPLIALSLIGTLNAATDPVCTSHPGVMHCGTGSVSGINYMGSVDLNGTTVTGALKVLGILNVQNAELNEVTMRGETHMNHSTVNNLLSVKGNFYISDSAINHSAIITGNFYGSRTQINEKADVTGFLEADSCQFNGHISLHGQLSAVHSKFSAPLTLKANKVTFSHSSAGDILFEKTGDNKEQVIHLSNGSVAGDISFVGQRGIVYVDRNSKINGKVEGGKIIQN